MKKLLLIVIFLLSMSCAHIDVPPESIIFLTDDEETIMVEKGYFNKENYGEKWMYLEDWNRLRKEKEKKKGNNI